MLWSPYTFSSVVTQSASNGSAHARERRVTGSDVRHARRDGPRTRTCTATGRRRAPAAAHWLTAELRAQKPDCRSVYSRACGPISSRSAFDFSGRKAAGRGARSVTMTLALDFLLFLSSFIDIFAIFFIRELGNYIKASPFPVRGAGRGSSIPGAGSWKSGCREWTTWASHATSHASCGWRGWL